MKETVKQVIKAVTRPLSWRALKPAAQGEAYSSWEAAAQAAGAYDDALLNRFRSARAQLGRDQGWEPDVIATPLPLLLNTCIGEGAVTDFGGAFGEMGMALARRYPRLIWRVIESPAVVALGQPSGNVSFHTEIPANCDIFFSSGTLQYLPNPYEILARGFETASFAVVITRSYSVGDAELFRVQTSPLYANGGGPIPPAFPDGPVSFPYRTLVEARILEIALGHCFELAYRNAQAETLVFLKARSVSSA